MALGRAVSGASLLLARKRLQAIFYRQQIWENDAIILE